jgi:hypothetical protein
MKDVDFNKVLTSMIPLVLAAMWWVISTLDALQDSTEDFRNSLHAIEATLSQIKWFAAGALALFFADSVGLGNAIKLLGL